uniref:Uncharacterized protein n=1 Tax=viral metagenome TaxID=1070528 RepID=A0A6C0CVQ7_9ZZZZ
MKKIVDYSKLKSEGVAYSELLERIYHKNPNNNRLFIEANSLRSTKELFRFCLDLFCKGLVMCHGGDSRRVEIDRLSMEQIQYVIDKLSYTGIMTIVRVLTKEHYHVIHDESEELESDNPLQEPLLEKQRIKDAYQVLQKSVEAIDKFPDNDPLQNYNFKILVGDCVYCISFEIHV